MKYGEKKVTNTNTGCIVTDNLNVIMAWKARYIDYVETEVKLPGGKPALIIMGIIGTAIMVIGLFYAGS